MSRQATRVIVVRHAEPAAYAAGRCYGRLDIGLSERGHRQAAQLARTLAREPLVGVYTSPALRARQTAAPIAAAHALDPTPIEAFAELNFGRLEGRTYDEIETSEPELYHAWMEQPTSVRFPDGESFTDLRARVLNDFARILRRHTTSTFAIVAHGGVTRIILAHALSIPRHAIFRLDQTYACVNLIDWFESEPIVRYLNQAADPTPDSRRA